jgi:hypothetical protein
MKKKIAKKPVSKKASVSNINSLSKADFENAVALIRLDISVLRKDMDEKFEKHENIILAEYRHRIETLETKVRELQTKVK